MLRFIFDIKNHHFMRLWWAQVTAQFGDRLSQMALIGLIAERNMSSASGLAKLLAFTIIPVFIIGPIAGVYVDRWENRRTLFVCDLLRAGLVLLIPMFFMDWPSMVPIYIIVFLIFCFSRFYVPAKMSIIPEVVSAENIMMANSLLTTTGMLAFVLGCAVGGIMVDQLGARMGLLVTAATYFISGLLIMSVRTDFKIKINREKIIERSKEILKIERSFLSELKEGVTYLFRAREIRFVINMLFMLLAGAGAIYVVIIVFIQESFKSVTRDLGILAVFLGAGLFVGAIAYGKWGKTVPWYRTIFLSLALGGAMMIVFAVSVMESPSLISAAVLAFLLGIVIGPIFIAANTIALVASDEKMRGKVFSSLEMVIHFAFLITMLLSSWLSEFIPRFAILVGVGGIFALVGAVGLIRYRRGGDLAFLTDKMQT